MKTFVCNTNLYNEGLVKTTELFCYIHTLLCCTEFGWSDLVCAAGNVLTMYIIVLVSLLPDSPVKTSSTQQSVTQQLSRLNNDISNRYHLSILKFEPCPIVNQTELSSKQWNGYKMHFCFLISSILSWLIDNY